MTEKQALLCPRARYYGYERPQNLVFNANLQEFAQRVSFIANLGTGGKLSPSESYNQIKALCQQLKSSKKVLGIGIEPVQDHEGGVL